LRRNFKSILIVGCLLAVTGLFLWAATAQQTLGADGDIEEPARPFAVGSLVVLEPETWKGKAFPLTRHIDVGKQLTRGEWLVILHRHDCPKCQAALRENEQSASSPASPSQSRRIALIELPPYGSPHDAPIPGILGRLSDRFDWFVEVPVKIVLIDGIVQSTSK
jgi:hypothetical protein